MTTPTHTSSPNLTVEDEFVLLTDIDNKRHARRFLIDTKLQGSNEFAEIIAGLSVPVVSIVKPVKIIYTIRQTLEGTELDIQSRRQLLDVELESDAAKAARAKRVGFLNDHIESNMVIFEMAAKQLSRAQNHTARPVPESRALGFEIATKGERHG
ncbi:hypothetical protein OHC33_002699 [Knufia fluminis]|uniref:Uncharacterized protein n=1 Tax=Knufia fluminis TaxID=191047 RepID=A0AAN8FD47_9EURO|nr:hypothetical protein OHC33_002699 [Knufia fluminis]